MKIAIVINSAPPFPVSGSEQQGLTMARHLAEHGHEVVVFARRYGGAPVVERLHGTTLVRVPFLDVGPFRFPTHLWNFRRLFARHAADASVTLAYQTFTPGYLAARAKRWFGVPFVLWIRSTMCFEFASSGRLRWAGRTFIPAVDRLLIQSERMRGPFLEEVRGAYGEPASRRLEGLLTVGRNAVEVRATAPSTGRELLFVGRLIPLKDLSTLFRALRRLPDPPPLRLVGDGPLRAALEAEARGLPVTFTGRVAPEALDAEYARGRALVLCSTTEGMPNVVLEAMAHGLPVISTPVASIPDVVVDDETGFLVPVGDDAALAERIARLFADDALHARLANGALRRVADYSWERVVAEVEGVLGGVGRRKQNP
jgi:glycosyltransferase involved in cell wall biosynthesis